MKKIKFYGIGGQGAVTASKVLSIAVSLYQDEYAVTIPAYGHERRGAPVYAHMIVDKVPVLLNCYVYEPDIVGVFEAGLIDNPAVNIGEGVSKDTVLVLNTGDKAVADRYKEKYGFGKVYYADATGIAEETINRNIPNSAMLGVLARTGVVELDSACKAIEEQFGKNGPKNSEAARKAYDRTVED